MAEPVAHRIRRVAGATARQLLLVTSINRLVFRLRFWWFVRVKRSVREHQEDSAVIASEYSRRMLLRGKTSDRPLSLIRPLAAIERVGPESRVLSIGSRFETELLYLVGHGFKKKNIRGLDMVSYSPWIDVGNMHELPYADNTWDVAILGWVMAYSDDPKRAAAEVVRVVRPGGLVAVALSYYPIEALERMQQEGTLIGGIETRVQTVDGLLAFFGDAVDEVFYRHDPDPNKEGSCAVIFSVPKL